MIHKFLTALLPLALASCSTTFQLKQPVEKVDICPMTAFEAYPELTAMYWLTLKDFADSNVHVGDLTCDKGQLPLMEVRISGTHIATTGERWNALGTTALGVAAPVAMIMMGFPIIVFWWDIPENYMVYTADLENSYESENVIIKREVSTTSYSGPPEVHFIKQRDAFKTDLEKLLEENFGKK
jgi:hypothetical protein